MGVAQDLMVRFSSPEIDLCDQGKLDLRRRARVSLFPWRGQFSPELVEELLADSSMTGPVVDPFVGSGTTLFECARRGIDAVGAEINPAALVFASLSALGSVSVADRQHVLRAAESALVRCLPPASGGLFQGDSESVDDAGACVKEALAGLQDERAACILRAAVLLAMAHGPVIDASRVQAEIRRLHRTLVSLPKTVGQRLALAADARDLPLADGYAAAAVTSPPYVNVFNYHQQYRPAVEFLGCAPLTVAAAELGSNRKHRQNRFLTVIQYALDMERVFTELRRVLTTRATAKVVIGRSSNVRGVPVKNSRLIAAVVEGSGTFQVTRWQERQFVTRFGEHIYEDILTMRRADGRPSAGFDARTLGVCELELAGERRLTDGVRSDIDAAIAASNSVKPSPMFDTKSIPWLTDPF